MYDFCAFLLFESVIDTIHPACNLHGCLGSKCQVSNSCTVHVVYHEGVPGMSGVPLLSGTSDSSLVLPSPVALSLLLYLCC